MPLAYGAIFAGVLILIAGFTGSTLPSVAQGKPDRAKASAPSAGASAQAPAASPSSSSGGGAWRSTQSAIAHERGWSLADWNAVIERESGGDPTNRNPSSGAFGIGQFLPSVGAEYPGALSANPVLQIKAMASYIAKRYGSPSAALAHERAYGWY